MKALKGLLVLVASLWFPLLTLQSATIFVDDDACLTGVGTGTSADPYCLLQTAYDSAVTNDTIQVRPGTYFECVYFAVLIEDPPLPPKPVSIIAEDFLPPPTGSNSNTTTIIDGVGNCDGIIPAPDEIAVVTVGHGVSLRGFTIQNGGRSGVLSFGSVVISNNIITGNASDLGGGIYVVPATCSYGDVSTSIQDNTVTNNDSFFVGFNAFSGEGGGIDIFGESTVAGAGCAGGDVTITLDGNTITNNRADVQGGGIGIFGQAEAGSSLQVIVTQNTISGNTVAAGAIHYGGGIWAGTHGAGNEALDITENLVDANQSGDDGGGISAVIDAQGTHSVNVTRNTIEDNSAVGNGGGLDLFIAASDLSPGQTASMTAFQNIVRRNTATSANLPLGGGGILGTLAVERSTQGVHFAIVGNHITDNDAELAGAGATIYVSADADQGGGGVPAAAPATAHLDFSNNLLAGNVSTDGSGSSVGGGLFSLLEAFGDGTASADVFFSTLDDNAADLGGGGIEVESFTGCDAAHAGVLCTPTSQFNGRAVLTVDHAIIADNLGYGIGGPTPGTGGIALGGTGNLTVDVTSSDFFNNDPGDFESTLTNPIPTVPPRPPALSQSDISTDNPNLDPNGPDNVLDNTPGTFDDYSHTLCSRFGWANPSSLADINADDLVGGIDILRISVAFGAGTDAARYTAAADITGDGIVDGDDLAVVASNFGDSCP